MHGKTGTLLNLSNKRQEKNGKLKPYWRRPRYSTAEGGKKRGTVSVQEGDY